MNRLICIISGFLFSICVQADALLAMDSTEVSNKAYAEFLATHADYKKPKYWDEYRSHYFINSAAASLAPFKKDTFTKADHPVVGVSWYAARDYCEWRGHQLPTHDQWMKMAGSDDGRVWPWGNDWDYKKANSGGEKWAENDGYIYSAPVNSFANGASPDNILNMAGNVAEWVQEQRVVGGSSNSSPSGVSIKASIDREPDYRSFDIGFRCLTK